MNHFHSSSHRVIEKSRVFERFLIAEICIAMVLQLQQWYFLVTHHIALSRSEILLPSHSAKNILEVDSTRMCNYLVKSSRQFIFLLVIVFMELNTCRQFDISTHENVLEKQRKNVAAVGVLKPFLSFRYSNLSKIWDGFRATRYSMHPR